MIIIALEVISYNFVSLIKSTILKSENLIIHIYPRKPQKPTFSIPCFCHCIKSVQIRSFFLACIFLYSDQRKNSIFGHFSRSMFQMIGFRHSETLNKKSACFFCFET